MAENSSYQRERVQLITFVRDTHRLLAQLVRRKRDPKGKPLFPRVFHKEINAAWSQFSNRFSLDRAATQILSADDAHIAAAGLYGAELVLKLSVVKRLRRLFNRTGGKRLLARLFNAIDNVLDRHQV